MSLSIQDIVTLASYDISTVNTDFIFNGDTFVSIAYRINNKNHIYFMDYGLCLNYEIEFKEDRSILMKYLSLSDFPPIPKTLLLKAHQIIQGKCISPDGQFEIHFKRLNEIFSIKKSKEFPNVVPFRKI